MTVLSVEDLRISYRSRGEWREVVHNISFSIQRGEMLAFVGESGSGKTTTAQAIIGLLADNARRDAGRIVLNGEVISDWSAKRLNRLRGVSISPVPQDPGNSLNPVKPLVSRWKRSCGCISPSPPLSADSRPLTCSLKSVSATRNSVLTSIRISCLAG